MKRRQWLAGGVAVAAAAAGAGVARWRSSAAHREHDAVAAEAGAEAALWAAHFSVLDGGDLAMASFAGQPLLLNFWATWCAPCRQEMPLLDQFFQQHKQAGWRVLGLAVDSVAPVRSYLRQQPVSFAVAVAGMDGAEWARRLGNADGALPFTVVFDRRGHIHARQLGQIGGSDLARWQHALR